SPSPARCRYRYSPPSNSTSASASQVRRSTLLKASAAVGRAATEPARAGRDDIDAVRLDAAVRLPRARHGDGLGLLQVGRLAGDRLAHDHALVEGDLDVGVAPSVMDGQAVEIGRAHV